MAWPRDSRLDALPDLYSRRRPNIITASPPVGHVCEKVVWMSHKRLSQPNRIVQECRQKICILVFQRNDASAATGFSPAAHNGRTIHPAPDGRGAGGAGGGAKPIAPPGKPGGTRRPYIGARAYCPAPDGRRAGGVRGALAPRRLHGWMKAPARTHAPPRKANPTMHIGPRGKPRGTRRPYIGARSLSPQRPFRPAPDERRARGGGAGGGSPPSFAWLDEGAAPVPEPPRDASPNTKPAAVRENPQNHTAKG